MSVGRDSSLLLIVDDWEALERYEERLSSHFTELEACPMPQEGLERAGERAWDRILLDLVLEDVTLAEAVSALKKNPVTAEAPLVVIGSEDELSVLPLGSKDRRIHRPFQWDTLVERLIF